nr:MAG TPA: hypothetical protein [Caudoviricetes sp.]
MCIFTRAFRETGRSFELGNEGIRLKNSNSNNSLILQNLFNEREKIMIAIDKAMDYTYTLSLMLRVQEIDKKIVELGGKVPARV